MSSYGDGGRWYTMPISRIDARGYGDAAANPSLWQKTQSRIESFTPSGVRAKHVLVGAGVTVLALALWYAYNQDAFDSPELI